MWLALNRRAVGGELYIPAELNMQLGIFAEAVNATAEPNELI